MRVCMYVCMYVHICLELFLINVHFLCTVHTYMLEEIFQDEMMTRHNIVSCMYKSNQITFLRLSKTQAELSPSTLGSNHWANLSLPSLFLHDQSRFYPTFDDELVSVIFLLRSDIYRLRHMFFSSEGVASTPSYSHISDLCWLLRYSTATLDLRSRCGRKNKGRRRRWSTEWSLLSELYLPVNPNSVTSIKVFHLHSSTTEDSYQSPLLSFVKLKAPDHLDRQCCNEKVREYIHCAISTTSRFIADTGARRTGYIILSRWIAAKRLRDHVAEEIAYREHGDDDPADPKSLIDGEEAV